MIPDERRLPDTLSSNSQFWVIIQNIQAFFFLTLLDSPIKMTQQDSISLLNCQSDAKLNWLPLPSTGVIVPFAGVWQVIRVNFFYRTLGVWKDPRVGSELTPGNQQCPKLFHQTNELTSCDHQHWQTSSVLLTPMTKPAWDSLEGLPVWSRPLIRIKLP